MNILGVDFSGAQNDRNTWLAQGFLENTRLSLASCACVSRDELAPGPGSCLRGEFRPGPGPLPVPYGSGG